MQKPDQKKPPLYVFHTECVYTRGGEKYLYELIRRLTDKYSVTLCVHSINLYWFEKFRNSSVVIDNIWRPLHLYWFFLPLTMLVNYFKFKNKLPPEALIFATNFPVNLLAVLLSRRTICHCFEPLAVFYDPNRIGSLPFISKTLITVARIFFSWLDKLAVRKSARFTALTPTVTPYITPVYGRVPDAYIPNGIDTEYYSQRKHRAKNKSFFKIGHSTDYTIFKGTEAFLAGINVLSKKSVSFRVYVSESIFDPVVREKYDDYIKTNRLGNLVTFMGNLNEADLVNFYQSLDVFCYTGSTKSAGGSTASLSVLEAQSCGTPVIRSYGNEEEIIPGITGFLIDPFNPDDIAEKITYLMSKQAKLSEMKKKARKFVATKHSWSFSSDVLDQILKSLK